MMKFFKTSLRALLCGAVLALCPMVCNAADGDKFKLVKSVSELNDGDKIILVKLNADSQGTNVALSTKSKSGQYIEGAIIEVSGDIATANNTTEIIQIEKESNDFYLKCLSNTMYLCNNCDDNSRNTIGFSDKKTTVPGCKGKVVKAAIEIDEINNYNAIISFGYLLKNAKDRMIGYGYSGTTSGCGQFRCYTLNEHRNDNTYSIKIFKQITDQVSLSESTDNAAVISSNKGKIVDVSLSRTLVADKWNTFCVPFDIDLTDGKLNGVEVRVMEFMSVESNIMCFGTTTQIKAGQAYLIKPLNESITNPLLPNVTISNKEPMTSGNGNYSFVGVYSPKSFDEQASKVSLFINGSAKLSRPKANSTMKGMRAYFACASEQAASAQLQLGGELTGVASIVSDVDEDGKIYNLNGVCIGKDIKGLSKGLYIKNGKKFVVK